MLFHSVLEPSTVVAASHVRAPRPVSENVMHRTPIRILGALLLLAAAITTGVARP